MDNNVRISVEPRPFSDGSGSYWNVRLQHLPHPGSVVIPAISERDAIQLAESLRASIEGHSIASAYTCELAEVRRAA